MSTLKAVCAATSTWLSSVGTYQQTCIDGLNSVDTNLGTSASQNLKNSTELTSNALAIISYFSNLLGGGQVKLRRLMESGDWVSDEDRSLLERKLTQITPNIIVAQDGTGHYKTIEEAIVAVPQESNKRIVIYVKKGVYFENVKISANVWNLMIYGDGRYETLVSGRLNFVDGTTTFQSATFAVLGKNFIARDIGFINTAGAIKQQAVALLAGGDLTIFYHCAMNAFQDTLYYTNRQLYRECDIFGTVDFIFGNSAAVFQNCNIFPRLPLLGQQDNITAQGKFDPNQKTGITIQNCTILPLGNLGATQVYLGRPWKLYSTTVYLENYLGSLINPQGWLPWQGTSGPSTIFYAEYRNRGPGSSIARRVKWAGVRSALWISAGIPYAP
ncbi:putative pectinesterase/pectinesterase inhibitor 46, partial [Drosera capensis]